MLKRANRNFFFCGCSFVALANLQSWLNAWVGQRIIVESFLIIVGDADTVQFIYQIECRHKFCWVNLMTEIRVCDFFYQLLLRMNELGTIQHIFIIHFIVLYRMKRKQWNTTCSLYKKFFLDHSKPFTFLREKVDIFKKDLFQMGRNNQCFQMGIKKQCFNRFSKWT